MARQRLILPGAPKDEAVAGLSIPARLAWAYLPCYADREGRMADKPFSLRLEIFPTDPPGTIDMEKILAELAKAELIIRYYVGSHRFIQIRTFLKHQKPHAHETASAIPPPPAEPEYVGANTDIGGRCSEVEPPKADARHPLSVSAALDPDPVSDPVTDPVGDPVPEAPLSGVKAGVSGTAPDRPTMPVDGFTLITCIRMAMIRHHPEVFHWDKGPFAEKEASEMLEDIPASKRIEFAPRLYALVDDFVKGTESDGWTVKAFRRYLSRVLAARASPPKAPPPQSRSRPLFDPKANVPR